MSLTNNTNIIDELWELNQEDFERRLRRLVPDPVHDQESYTLLASSPEASLSCCAPSPCKRARTGCAPHEYVTSAVLDQAIIPIMDSGFLTPKELGRLLLFTCKSFVNNVGANQVYKRCLELLDTEDAPQDFLQKGDDKWLLEKLVRQEPTSHKHKKPRFLLIPTTSKHLEWEELSLAMSIWKNNATKLCSITVEGLSLGLALMDDFRDECRWFHTCDEDNEEVSFCDSDSLQVRAQLFRNDTMQSCPILHETLEAVPPSLISGRIRIGEAAHKRKYFQATGRPLAMDTQSWENTAEKIFHLSSSLPLPGVQELDSPLCFSVDLGTMKQRKQGKKEVSTTIRYSGISTRLSNTFLSHHEPQDFLLALGHLKDWA